jgi:hypothetical protein
LIRRPCAYAAPLVVMEITTDMTTTATTAMTRVNTRFDSDVE